MFNQDIELDTLVHAFNTVLGVQEEDQEFKANLGYIEAFFSKGVNKTNIRHCH